MESGGIHEIVVRAIRKCDMDVRREMYANVVLSGVPPWYPAWQIGYWRSWAQWHTLGLGLGWLHLRRGSIASGSVGPSWLHWVPFSRYLLIEQSKINRSDSSEVLSINVTCFFLEQKVCCLKWVIGDPVLSVGVHYICGVCGADVDFQVRVHGVRCFHCAHEMLLNAYNIWHSSFFFEQ